VNQIHPSNWGRARMAEISKYHRSGQSGVKHVSGAETVTGQPVVFVLDDDADVREALASLLLSMGLQVLTFGSAAEFLKTRVPDGPACLVLDLQLPDVNGLELQQKIAETNGPPVVFISGHGDIPSSVKAMKAGAIEFLPKPFSDQELLEAIHNAIAQDRETRRSRADLTELRKSYALLSAREREVLPLIVAGLKNKESAEKLGIAEITLQVHRAQIMRKMSAGSVTDLVRMATKLGIT
jgi:FixJ family two-component response regulator